MLAEKRIFAHEIAAAYPDLICQQSIAPDVWQEMARRGLLAVDDPACIALAGEALAEETGSLGLALAWTANCLVPLALERYASLPGEIKAGLRQADAFLALAVSEPKAGAHPKYLSTTAVQTASGWMLNGEKAYVTNGTFATYLAVLAITRVDLGRKRYSLFLVPAGTGGLTRIETASRDVLRPAQHCDYLLENCLVPDSALIGRPGSAYEDFVQPFRNLEDAVGASLLTGVLMAAARLVYYDSNQGQITADAAIRMGELASILAAMKALSASILTALGCWDTGEDIADGYLVAVDYLARQSIDILQGNTNCRNIRLSRILEDAADYLSIARNARETRKERLGRTFFSADTTILDTTTHEPTS